jgi:hypothetical protein
MNEKEKKDRALYENYLAAQDSHAPKEEDTGNGRVIRVSGQAPQAPEMDLQKLAGKNHQSLIPGQEYADTLAAVATPLVTAFSGYNQGALPGRMGEIITPEGVDQNSPVFKGAKGVGFVASPVYRGLSNLLAGAGGRLLPYATKTFGEGAGRVTEVAPTFARRLGRNAITGGGIGAAEGAGNVVANVAEGKPADLAEIPTGAAYGVALGALPGERLERGAELLRKERVPQKVGELGWRGSALTGAKKTNPSNSPMGSMQDLGISGSPVSVQDQAGKVRAESGARVEDAYGQLFEMAEKNGFKLNVFGVVEPILKRMDELYRSGQQSAQESIDALGRYADRILKSASGDMIGPREIHAIVEAEKANLQARKGDKMHQVFGERQVGQPTPTDMDAGRMIISHGSDQLKKAARVLGQESGNPSFGRALEAELARYGKAKDVQRFSQDVEAERSGKMVGDLAGRAGRLMFRPGMTSSAGEFLNRATLPPGQGPVSLNPFKNPLGPAGVSTVQDPIRMLQVGVQGGQVSPEAAGQMVLEILNKGSGQ